MPILGHEELTKRAELTTADVLPNHVARYWDLVALSDRQPVKVIGADGILRDRPGFEVHFITRGSAGNEARHHDRPAVLMPVKGHWRVDWKGGSTTLAKGDTMSVPADLAYRLTPSMSGEAALYHVLGTDDPAGPTQKP
jgi:mannose-6-phosphate isomerase-like protein (cupin superfamily)